MWTYVIAKERDSVEVTFDVIDNDTLDPILGYQIINCHMIFDMNIEIFSGMHGLWQVVMRLGLQQLLHMSALSLEKQFVFAYSLCCSE